MLSTPVHPIQGEYKWTTPGLFAQTTYFARPIGGRSFTRLCYLLSFYTMKVVCYLKKKM